MKIKKNDPGFFARRLPMYKELEKTVRDKDDALRLSESIIQSNKDDIARLQKKIVSDSNLIESLNRYILTLEGRDKERLDRIKELEEKLNVLLAIPGNQNAEANND